MSAGEEGCMLWSYNIHTLSSYEREVESSSSASNQFNGASHCMAERTMQPVSGTVLEGQQCRSDSSVRKKLVG